MNRIYLKFNWPSKVIALVALLGFTTTQGHAQTTIIQDNFSTGGAMNGATPDTIDLPGTTWAANAFDRDIRTTYGYPVTSPYASASGYGAGITFTGYGQNILNLNISAYKNAGDQGGNQIAFGFSTVSSLDSDSAGGGYVGFVGESGGLAVFLSSDGSGSLNLGGNYVTGWSSPLDFTPSTGDGSTVGLNAFTLSYNNVTDIATVTEAGDLVATANVGSLDLNSAGIGAFYPSGTARSNGGSPDGFAAFSVTTQAVIGAPEPSTWALMLSGAVGLFYFRRLRSVFRS